jgi:hypothetical protein
MSQSPWIRRVLAAAGIAAAFTFAPPASRADLDPGAAMPAFEGKEFINTEEISLPDLRGKIVFYEIFRTW